MKVATPRFLRLSRTWSLSLKPANFGILDEQALCPVVPKRQDDQPRLAEFLERDQRPISLIDGDGYRDFVKLLDPHYQVISQNTCSERFAVPLYKCACWWVKESPGKSTITQFYYWRLDQQQDAEFYYNNCALYLLILIN